MESDLIPLKLDDWEPRILDELIKYVDIESENFDFKKEISELEIHLCAMANTSGGFLVLGIEEVKSSDSTKIISYKKIGFEKGKEDSIQLQVTNSIFNIEPNPTFKIKNIPDGEKFYTVLKIENEIFKKPFFIKNKGQCYVRIGNSSRPASRSVIMNLFTSGIELQKNVEKLRVASILVKESIMHSTGDMGSAHPMTSTKLPPVDLTFLRDAILSSDWFLREINLFGEHTTLSSHTIGVNSILHEITLMNSYVEAYNRETNKEERLELLHQLSSWNGGTTKMQEIFRLLDDIKTSADRFLSKYK